MEKYSIDYWKEKNVNIYEEKPKGWIKNEGATTAPRGYSWYNNGESRFGGNYQNALVHEETTKYQIMGDK